MNESQLARNRAIQQIKEVIYDLQIGASEIIPAKQVPLTYCVRFDNRAGRQEEVLVRGAATYREIYMVLKTAHDRRR